MTNHIELNGNTPLREQVYNYLKRVLNNGSLKAGTFLDLNAIGQELKLSRTPLRDALIRLEVEGFVIIHSRRGVMVKPLEISEIRDIYQIIGALEASAILEVAPQFDNAALDTMSELSNTMHRALEADDFSSYYAHNVAFHDSYLIKSNNNWLRNTVHHCKERLYDFPRRRTYLRGWEEASILEHETLVQLLREGHWQQAGDYIRDVHWSFSAQEKFIKEYYFAGLSD